MSLFTASADEPFKGPHQPQPVSTAGAELDQATAALIMVHGRGASAAGILGLSEEIDRSDIHYAAPQASGHTWYPYSFLEPTERNEPGISSGLQKIFDLVGKAEEAGIPAEKIFILGFSQGACLASEFVARHPRHFGGLFALSGGLIGDTVDPAVYEGDLSSTKVFMGCSDTDPHIPESRVHESKSVFEKLGADVNVQIYPGMGHLVNHDEIEHIQRIISDVLGPVQASD